MNYFAKFETFIPYSIIIPSFMIIGSQMPELDRGGGASPPYNIGSQNTPYKLRLKVIKRDLNLPLKFLKALKRIQLNQKRR